MASLVQRGKRYCVVYTYENDAGEKKQKWETFPTKEDALRRKTEVEYRKSMDNIIIPPCDTMNDLLKEYIAVHGKNTWAISAYTSNVKLIRSYIQPYLGQMKLREITARTLEKYYQKKGPAAADAATVSAPAAAASQCAASAEDRQLLEKLMGDKSTVELLIALVKKLT